MNPGLCLDSGEFVTAAELNRRIEMKHELPPLLSHPEPHSMAWTAIEGRAIAEYAQQVADPLLARIADLEANALGWLQANGPSGWIDDLRVRAESLEVQNLELERLCDATYVAKGADAYNHACAEMERYQRDRAAAGKEVGTEGSLCDGMEWLYEKLDKLEAQLASGQQPTKADRMLACVEAFAIKGGWTAEGAAESDEGAFEFVQRTSYRQGVEDAKTRSRLQESIASGQEPIAWFDEEMQSAYTRTELDGGAIEGLIPLYAHPAPAQQPLSDDQKQRIHDETGAGHALISLVELCIKEKP